MNPRTTGLVTLLLACAVLPGTGSPPAASALDDMPIVPHGRMTALLEKTLFKVDVVAAEIRVDAATAAKLGNLVAGQKYSEGLADQVSRAVLAAPDVWIRMEFKRGIKQKQYLKGIEANMKRALDAAWISPEHFDDVVAHLPEWYVFLAERGIQDGDTMEYRLRGDTTQYRFTAADGKVLLEMDETDTRSRYGILGGYFAPKAEFRKRLVRSLLS